jgi:hypothetical protein
VPLTQRKPRPPVAEFIPVGRGPRCIASGKCWAVLGCRRRFLIQAGELSAPLVAHLRRGLCAFGLLGGGGLTLLLPLSILR